MARYLPPLADRFAAAVRDLTGRVQALEARTALVNSADLVYARWGVVDPGYTSGDPQVTVDGDAGLSGPYPYLRPYRPAASDYVVLVPAGGSYAVAGTATGPADVLCVARSAGTWAVGGGGGWEGVQWTGADDVDTAGMHDPGSDAQRFTPPAGWYTMSGWVDVAASAAGTFRQVAVIKNGDTGTFYGFHRVTHFTAGLACIVGCTSVAVYCDGDDYLEFLAAQNSGGPLTLGVSRVQVRRVRRP